MSDAQLVGLVVMLVGAIFLVACLLSEKAPRAPRMMEDLEESKGGRPRPLIHRQDQALKVTRFDLEMERRRRVREMTDKASQARKG